MAQVFGQALVAGIGTAFKTGNVYAGIFSFASTPVLGPLATTLEAE